LNTPRKRGREEGMEKQEERRRREEERREEKREREREREREILNREKGKQIRRSALIFRGVSALAGHRAIAI
jgi:hypothetical protein